MDKYEYNIKADQIMKLIDRRDFKTAAKIADGIDWRRVRNINMLTNVGCVYQAVGRYMDAKEIFQLARNRAPLGRRLVYQMADICIDAGDFEEAEHYIQEFSELAPKDTARFELLYQLSRRKGEPIENQIAILEEFKNQDFDERWSFELAKLYHKAGYTQKCIAACDELILWFGEGQYVDKAMELKMLHAPLSPSQQEKYNMHLKKKQEEERTNIPKEQTKQTEQNEQKLQKGQKETPSSNRKKRRRDEGYSTENLQAALTKSIQEIMDAEERHKTSYSSGLSYLEEYQSEQEEREAMFAATRDLRREREKFKNMMTQPISSFITDRNTQRESSMQDLPEQPYLDSEKEGGYEAAEEETRRVFGATESDFGGMEEEETAYGAAGEENEYTYEMPEENHNYTAAVNEPIKAEHVFEPPKEESGSLFEMYGETAEGASSNVWEETGTVFGAAKREKPLQAIDSNSKASLKNTATTWKETNLKKTAADWKEEKESDLKETFKEKSKYRQQAEYLDFAEELEEAKGSGISEELGEGSELYKEKLEGEDSEFYEEELEGEDSELYGEKLEGEDSELYGEELEGEDSELYGEELEGEDSELYGEELEGEDSELYEEELEGEDSELYEEELEENSELYKEKLKEEDSKLYKEGLKGEDSELYKEELEGEDSELYKEGLEGEDSELYKEGLEGEDSEFYKKGLEEEDSELYKEELEKEDSGFYEELEEENSKPYEEEDSGFLEEFWGQEFYYQVPGMEEEEEPEYVEVPFSLDELDTNEIPAEVYYRISDYDPQPYLDKVIVEKKEEDIKEEKEELQQEAVDIDRQMQKAQEQSEQEAKKEEKERKAGEALERKASKLYNNSKETFYDEPEEIQEQLESKESKGIQKQLNSKQTKETQEQSNPKQTKETQEQSNSKQTKEIQEQLKPKESEEDFDEDEMSYEEFPEGGTEEEFYYYIMMRSYGVEELPEDVSYQAAGYKKKKSESKTPSIPSEAEEDFDYSYGVQMLPEDAYYEVPGYDPEGFLAVRMEKQGLEEEIFGQKPQVRIQKNGTKKTETKERTGYQSEHKLESKSEIKPESKPKSKSESKAKSKSKAEQQMETEELTLELAPEFKNIFANYLHMPEVEQQIAEILYKTDRIDKERQTSVSGNILIMGEVKSGKTTLAVSLVKAINRLNGRRGRKVAKISGDRLNSKGIKESISRLAGADLIIEHAGEMRVATVTELLEALEDYTGGMIVILEDTKTAIERLLGDIPKIASSFTHRIELKECNIAEWAEAAKSYAMENNYMVDDMAMLALSAKIDGIYANKKNIMMEDVQDIIDAAIEKAERRNKKLFGRLFSKKKDSDAVLLRESDFS